MVWEVAQELAFHDAAFTGRCLEKALTVGVRFTTDQSANCHTSLRVLLRPLLLRNEHQHGCEFSGNKRDGSL